MPLIWMSVWLEGATTRNGAMLHDSNLLEPRGYPLFHADRYIPPLPQGYAGGAFMDEMQKIHTCLLGQLGTLATAGQWMAQAKKAGKRIWSVLVGHSYPRILDLPDEPEKYDYPVEWGHSLSDLAIALPHDFGKGDVGVHLGYGPINRKGLDAWMKKGVRLIHTTPYGKYSDFKDPANFLWFDLPWRPADATVDIPGYSVRILPGSSAAQSMAYWAMLAEMAHRMGWT